MPKPDPNPPRFWFPAKIYGWGWGLPSMWEGCWAKSLTDRAPRVTLQNYLLQGNRYVSPESVR